MASSPSDPVATADPGAPAPGPAAAAAPSADAPRVVASVLYWRAHEVPLVQGCVASLLAQHTPGIDLRVLVVDNGCGVAVPLPTDARLSLLRLPENRGFTGGHNAAMRRALDLGADFVFLVNSDVVADPDCVRELAAAARAWPSAGLLGPLVLRRSDPRRVESAGQAFDRWTGRHREVARGLDASAVDPRPRSVDAASGAALLASRAVLEQVGLLDEALFFYFEDMDWCLRARRAGFDVVVAPAARVWHVGGGSTGPASPRTTFFSVRNHLCVATRYARPRRALAPVVLAYHLAFVITSAQRRSPAHLRAALRGALDGWRGRLGPAPPT